MEHILETIALIRDSFDNSVEVYTKGKCIEFCLILRHLYPEGIILYDDHHAIFEYKGWFVDITGLTVKRGHRPIEEYLGVSRYLTKI